MFGGILYTLARCITPAFVCAHPATVTLFVLREGHEGYSGLKGWYGYQDNGFGIILVIISHLAAAVRATLELVVVTTVVVERALVKRKRFGSNWWDGGRVWVESMGLMDLMGLMGFMGLTGLVGLMGFGNNLGVAPAPTGVLPAFAETRTVIGGELKLGLLGCGCGCG